MPDRWTRLSQRSMTRRALIDHSARAGIGAAGIALVGCGGNDDEPTPEPATAAPAPQAQPDPQARPDPQAQPEPDEDTPREQAEPEPAPQPEPEPVEQEQAEPEPLALPELPPDNTLFVISPFPQDTSLFNTITEAGDVFVFEGTRHPDATIDQITAITLEKDGFDLRYTTDPARGRVTRLDIRDTITNATNAFTFDYGPNEITIGLLSPSIATDPIETVQIPNDATPQLADLLAETAVANLGSPAPSRARLLVDRTRSSLQRLGNRQEVASQLLLIANVASPAGPVPAGSLTLDYEIKIPGTALGDVLDEFASRPAAVRRGHMQAAGDGRWQTTIPLEPAVRPEYAQDVCDQIAEQINALGKGLALVGATLLVVSGIGIVGGAVIAYLTTGSAVALATTTATSSLITANTVLGVVSTAGGSATAFSAPDPSTCTTLRRLALQERNSLYLAQAKVISSSRTWDRPEPHPDPGHLADGTTLPVGEILDTGGGVIPRAVTINLDDLPEPLALTLAPPETSIPFARIPAFFAIVTGGKPAHQVRWTLIGASLVDPVTEELTAADERQSGASATFPPFLEPDPWLLSVFTEDEDGVTVNTDFQFEVEPPVVAGEWQGDDCPTGPPHWEVTISATDDVIAGEVRYHACPGRGRAGYSFSLPRNRLVFERQVPGLSLSVTGRKFLTNPVFGDGCLGKEAPDTKSFNLAWTLVPQPGPLLFGGPPLDLLVTAAGWTDEFLRE